jgi:hypothetical protein
MGVSPSTSMPPEIIQLTADVQVFSGFKPPPELLERATRPQGPAAAGQFPASTGAEKPPPGLEETGGELPTYDEAVADGLTSPTVVDEDRRGRFEVDEKHLQGAESWDADEKR